MPPAPGARVAALLPGLVLLGYALALLRFARWEQRAPDEPAELRPWLCATSMASGALYLLGLARGRAALGPRFLAWTLFCALLARALVSLGPPLLEDDFQRYLWDGAVAAHGISPYRHAPDSVVAGSEGALGELAARAGPVLSSINHPHLTTIYPPLAQAFFALAHWLDPFGLGGLRMVLFLADVATTLLVWRWLRFLSLPDSALAWYVASPLLLRTTYSALHMDVLVLPFVMGAALLAAKRRAAASAALCLAGALVKLWPVLLLPSLWPRAPRRPGRLAVGALILVAVAPFALGAWGLDRPTSNGFLAYGESWQNNDGFFRAGIWLTETLLVQLSLEPWRSHALMRVVVAGLLAALVVGRTGRARQGEPAPAREFLLVVAAVFLLSPTQFPWYAVWMLPLLAVHPVPAMLLYTVTLPLYELQHLGSAVYWLEHLPVWLLLAREGVRLARARRNDATLEVAHA